MKTILVLAQSPDFAEAIHSAVNPENYRVIHRISPEWLNPCCSTACSTCASWTWNRSKCRCAAVDHRKVAACQVPQAPLLVYSGLKELELGEGKLTSKAPLSMCWPSWSAPRMLIALLERIYAGTRNRDSATPVRCATGTRVARFSVTVRPIAGAMVAAPRAESVAWETVRHFASDFDAFTCCCFKPMLEEVPAPALREIVWVNRASIFLREPVATFGEKTFLRRQSAHLAQRPAPFDRPPDCWNIFDLSFDTGIGGQSSSVQVGSPGVPARKRGWTSVVQQEFEMLGVKSGRHHPSWIVRP